MKISRILASSVVTALVLRAGLASAAALCGDTDSSGTVLASDALSVLRKAVGQPITLVCPDYIDRYGDPADFNLTTYNEPNYLLGRQIEIEKAARITHIGLIAREGGGQVRMVVYTDNAGEPDQHVTGSLATPILPGSQEIPVLEKNVAPGKYWIMGLYDTLTYVAGDDAAPPGNLIKYRAQTFAQGVPGTFGPAVTYDQARLNYWVKVKQ